MTATSIINTISSVSKHKEILLASQFYFIFIYLLWFTPCKAEQPLQGMELQENKHKKIKAYKEYV